MNLVDKDDFVIKHDLLQKYGVVDLEGGSGKIKRFLEQHNFIEDHDFKVTQMGFTLTYMLKPDIFKKALMRSRNTDKYADYYLLLEKCIKHYGDHQILKLQKNNS